MYYHFVFRHWTIKITSKFHEIARVLKLWRASATKFHYKCALKCSSIIFRVHLLLIRTLYCFPRNCIILRRRSYIHVTITLCTEDAILQRHHRSQFPHVVLHNGINYQIQFRFDKLHAAITFWCPGGCTGTSGCPDPAQPHIHTHKRPTALHTVITSASLSTASPIIRYGAWRMKDNNTLMCGWPCNSRTRKRTVWTWTASRWTGWHHCHCWWWFVQFENSASRTS